MSEKINVNFLVDSMYGHEAEQSDQGAVARFFQAHVTRRPAQGAEPRWPSIAAMKCAARGTGPSVTDAQIDSVVAALEAITGV